MNAERRQHLARLVCWFRGHQWVWRGELVYDGCWCSDEVCSRCGGESWWPQ